MSNYFSKDATLKPFIHFIKYQPKTQITYATNSFAS